MHSSALYVQIYEKILAAIRNGEYAENAPLPSERYLCDKYHVSRSTIRQAMQLLKESDVVYTVQGNGTFIKPQVYTQPLTQFYSFADTLKNSGVLIQNTIVGYEQVTADTSLARNAECAPGATFHQIVRLRSAKEYPLMLETTYLPCARFAELDLDALSKGSLYDFLRKNYNFHADSIRETLRPVMPRPEEKSLLQMPPNSPCILLERFSYEGDLLIEYTKSIVRGDKYIFHVDLRQK
ncbi:MAG: GntR family transcriptional regulator [Clostridia bacterium]|nr:GntR family transcriptional regulator [Clostridia bacterium]